MNHQGTGVVGFSMGRVGSAADNAAMEPFFALFQKDVLGEKTWATREQLQSGAGFWIQRFMLKDAPVRNQ